VSNPLAIAAVTATVRNLLLQDVTSDPDLADTTVTTQAPDRARGTLTSNQLNLFLYQTVLSAAWRNTDIPQQVQRGERGFPALGLNLYYLMTAYGRDNDDVFGHRVLGRAMRLLHDHALLGPDEIKSALLNNDLWQQVERVRITPQPLTVDEMSKLWTIFQTQYRISAAYEMAVVLIESRRTIPRPLPVLTRGPGDLGVVVQVDLTPPFPTILSVTPPSQQISARLGDTVVITGHHLDGAAVVRFTSPLAGSIDVPPLAGGTATTVSVQIPNDPVNWPAGLYAMTVVIQRPGAPDRLTNDVPILVAPRILNVAPNPAPRDATGSVTLQVTCSPEVRPAQRASLLIDDREVLAQPVAAQTNLLTFPVPLAPPGTHYLRLRVDGVESWLVDRTQAPPIFDPTQRVTIA
jgi:uncharacterized protein DUF4255